MHHFSASQSFPACIIYLPQSLLIMAVFRSLSPLSLGSFHLKAMPFIVLCSGLVGKAVNMSSPLYIFLSARLGPCWKYWCQYVEQRQNLLTWLHPGTQILPDKTTNARKSLGPVDVKVDKIVSQRNRTIFDCRTQKVYKPLKSQYMICNYPEWNLSGIICSY